MKNLPSLLTALLLVYTLNACSKKEEAPATPQTQAPAAESPKPAAMPQKMTPAAPQPAKATSAAPVKTDKAETVTEIPQKPQDAIDEVNTYAREKTGTQVSKARNRAQAAEDEMMRELGK